MSVLQKLERELTRAELAQVRGLIERLTPRDLLTRISLESRERELRDRAERLSIPEERPAASAALFFGGRPVLGGQGIESEFGGKAVATFQDLLAKTLANKMQALGQRGVVPNKSASTMHITNIVRGSFGFLLQEMQSQEEMIPTALSEAVESASSLLEAIGAQDEEVFRTAAEEIDDRVLATAKDFFSLMRQNGATLRVVSSRADRSFGTEEVARGADRASSTRVEETEETRSGALSGVLPDSRQFEFTEENGTIDRGRIGREVAAERVNEFIQTWVGVPAEAQLKIKRVTRNEEVVRMIYTLLDLRRR